MSGCRKRPQDASHLTSDAHGMIRLSKSCKSDPSLNLQLKSKQIFCITASSNVCVSQAASRCIPSDIGCTWHEQGVVVLQTERTFASPTWIETNFLHQGKFECLGVASGLKMHHIWHCMHMAWTCNRGLANRTYLWIRNCSEEQIFCIRASSNVWVSHLSSRCIPSDSTCTYHEQVDVVSPI